MNYAGGNCEDRLLSCSNKSRRNKMSMKQALIVFAVCASLASCAGKDVSRSYWPTKDWQASRPEKQGFDSERLIAIDNYIKKDLPKTTSLLVIRNGYIVFERYYEGDRSTLRPLYSIPKSFISCLVGVLLQKGFLKSTDEKMMAFFAEYRDSETNPETEKITIGHLLTMSDGLSGSSIKTAVAQPLSNEPGRDFQYREISAEIVSMIITKTTGWKALDFGQKYLFEPLGISNVSWSEKQGYTNGADGLELTIRDAAKLGYLYLKKGMWNKEQIISSEWVTESTRKQIDVPESRGWTKAYGFYWWLRDTVGHESYIAAGYGPQLLYVVPDLNLIVVLTTNDNMYPGPPYLPLIDDKIVAAITN
jgi:CubicO group peptidase (beta-lactamase class C family)